MTRKRWGSPGALALLALTLTAAGQLPQTTPPLGRSVEGVVLNALNQPLPGAIVYLRNVQTKLIRSVVTDAKGAYAFHHLQPNVSYQVYAEWQGYRTPLRTDSLYSSQEVMRLDLTISVS
ncbi:MAG: carboxypeptidase-like regulatory domain-containing protein [Terriglobales bacterium]